MTLNRYVKTKLAMRGTISVVAAFIACTSGAATPASGTIASATTEVAQVATATNSVNVVGYPTMEAGVRKAAEEGAESLRRYIQRTRMIYNYSYWNFAKEQ